MRADATFARLLAASCDGDLAAWRMLLQRWLPSVAAYLGARLRRVDVLESLLVETATEAWRHLDPAVTPAEFPRWLRRMAASVALRWHRRHPDEELERPLPDAVLQAAGTRAEAVQRLDAAMGSLSAEQRMAVEQRYRGGLQGADLAEVLHCSPEQAEQLVHQAVLALALALESDDASD